jgi:hypothetical protein
MYRQSDGYPAGMGNDLHSFLEPFHIVNGLKLNENRTVANGAGCLAAQLVCHFKDGSGGIYLYPPNLGQNVGQEYEYHIHIKGKEIALIRVLEPCMEIFSGSLFDFGLWLNSPQTN